LGDRRETSDKKPMSVPTIAGGIAFVIYESLNV
jgi:hypothetical protein